MNNKYELLFMMDWIKSLLIPHENLLYEDVTANYIVTGPFYDDLPSINAQAIEMNMIGVTSGIYMYYGYVVPPTGSKDIRKAVSIEKLQNLKKLGKPYLVQITRTKS